MAQRPPIRSPRVGAHVDDAFLGDTPVGRPEGLDPFAGDDTSAEGPIALEVLSKMSRTTGSYDTVQRPRVFRRWAIALIAAGIVIAGGLFILANH